MKIYRHLGVIKNTGARCVVIIPQLHENEENALIVDTDSLPPKYQDRFHEVVMNEGQKNTDLTSVLNTRVFADGGVILQTLHNDGMLRTIPVSNLRMKVTDTQHMDLSEIVNATNPEAEAEAESLATPDVKETPVAEAADAEEIAKGKRIQAELLETDAKRLRAEADVLLFPKPITKRGPKRATKTVTKRGPRRGTKAVKND